jgi:hypothetical protein
MKNSLSFKLLLGAFAATLLCGTAFAQGDAKPAKMEKKKARKSKKKAGDSASSAAAPAPEAPKP